jgi:phosphohistidine swiveling domain-containing protein
MDFGPLRQMLPTELLFRREVAMLHFRRSVNANELSVISNGSVNQALVKELRDQAPLVSMSAGMTASAKQVVSYSFQRSETVVPADDSVNVTINGTVIAVDLSDIDGLGTSCHHGGTCDNCDCDGSK